MVCIIQTRIIMRKYFHRNWYWNLFHSSCTMYMQGSKGGEQDHLGEGGAVAVRHLADEQAREKLPSSPPPPHDHHHAGSGLFRWPSPANNTSSSGDDTVSSSERLQQRHYCSDGGGGMGVRLAAVGLPAPPPPSLEMSLGRQGWQMEQRVGDEFEFESSSPPPAPNELTMLKCL